MTSLIYVRGRQSPCGSRAECPLTTSSVLFTAQYCQTQTFRLVFVEEDNRKCSDEPYCCSYILKDLKDIVFSFLTWDELPGPVRNVSLPAVYQPGLSLVRSGVCVLLRHVIKESHLAKPDLNLVDLLGFRQGSMKMCAEVSGWTKLCEVDLATSVSDLIGRLNEDSVETNGVQDGCHLTLPLDLLKLESHFGKKCRIHNSQRRQRSELARLLKRLNQSDFRDAKNYDFRSLPRQIGSSHSATDSSPTTGPEQNFSRNYGKDKEVNSSSGDIETLRYDGERLLIEHSTSLHHGVRKLKVDKKFKTCVKSVSNHCDRGDRSATGSDEKDANLSNNSTAVGLDLGIESQLDSMCLGNGATSSDKSPLKTLHDGATSSDKSPLNTLGNGATSSDKSPLKTLRDAIEELTYKDIEFVHFYSEGAEMTIADLILLTYIYHLVASLGFTCAPLKDHIPKILRWAAHLTSLDPVGGAGAALGWAVVSFQSALQRSQLEPHEPSGCVVFVSGGSSGMEEDDMELSRHDKMKAFKPRVGDTLRKLELSGIGVVTGSHPCGEEVEVDWTNLPSGVHPKEGKVPEKRTRRKCQQLENLVTAVQSVARPGDIIVDFCSGGGHLGIVLAYLLPQCQIYLVENKEESLLKACARLADLRLTNVTLYQCNLDYFRGEFQVGVCLHACGSATDMVLQLCLDTRAGFVICPCCYGSIRETHLLTYPRSNTFLSSNLDYQDFLNLGHAADQTEFNIALETQGRTCMNLVDTDRGEFARQHGYLVTLCSLQPLTCSPKNNLLIGTPISS